MKNLKTFNWKKFLLWANFVSLLIRIILQAVVLLRYEKTEANQSVVQNMWIRKKREDAS
jgi:hypothetical protein